MVAFTPKRRAVSRGIYNSKNIGKMSCNLGERGKKLYFPVWGESQKDGNPSRPLPKWWV
jgi:hypothetical protein